ncbi:MAG: hypothetical protein DRG83_00315 [Deltaproteobacteria bacterium]|nr:MAG: hypothetical protein DRG83_00315 [Deltaproteobacteria bacterium]
MRLRLGDWYLVIEGEVAVGEFRVDAIAGDYLRTTRLTRPAGEMEVRWMRRDEFKKALSEDVRIERISSCPEQEIEI